MGLVDGMVVVFFIMVGMWIGGDLFIGECVWFFFEYVIV